jgi:hypothetical protein
MPLSHVGSWVFFISLFLVSNSSSLPPVPNIRPYTSTDLPQLQTIHAAQSFAYPFPDLDNPLFLTKLVLTDSGRELAHPKILGAALLRLTAEAYLLLDPHSGTPRERWDSLLHLHAAAECEATARGLDDVHAWLPPPIATKFGKRLTQLGWLRDDTWTPFCKRLR